MRYDVDQAAFPESGTLGGGDLSFAVFSLKHAACGDHVVEMRLGDGTLLEWCMACSVVQIFGDREV
jgi:hypothetical protein